MGRKTAEYHLYYLARLGHVRVERAPDEPTRFAHLAARPRVPAGPLEESILALVRARPGVSARAIAKELGLTRLRVDGRAKDLISTGALTSRVERGCRRLYPTENPAA
jgi:hypothetical protein